MFAGAAFVAHSDLISGVRGDEEEYSEMLSLRSRSKRLAEHVQGHIPDEAFKNLPPEVIQNLPVD
jgi:hypothetical protein